MKISETAFNSREGPNLKYCQHAMLASVQVTGIPSGVHH